MENCCIDEAACCCSALPFVDGDLSMANKVACFTYCQHPPGTDDAQSPLVIRWVSSTAVKRATVHRVASPARDTTESPPKSLLILSVDVVMTSDLTGDPYQRCLWRVCHAH